MNERRKLKRQLSRNYKYKRYMTAGEAKALLNSKKQFKPLKPKPQVKM